MKDTGLTRQPSEAHDPTLLRRARALWQEDGAPPGRLEDYIERARELIANEVNRDAALEPVRETVADPALRPYGEPVEPVEAAIRNQGDFPTLTDQGEEPLFPEGERNREDRR